MGEKATIKSIANGMLNFVVNGIEQNLPVAQNVKPEFVRAGAAEVTVKEGIVTFVKMEKAQSNFSSGAAKTIEKNPASYYISYAKDLCVAGKIEVEQIAETAKGFAELAKTM